MGKRIFGLVLASGLAAMAQVPNAVPSEPPQLLSPEQLDNLVAPVALYPDQLLSQVLAASTYPLEIVEAQQWLQRNGNLQGSQLMDAAKQQNWDASVQAMVAFPDAMALLTRDVQWTTALGNAFLAQQADVMNAIQEMRARAQNNGRLVNTPQQTITTQAQDGQSAIAIQPANPQVMYVPSYNPEYVWGPPAAGYYPQLGYPSNSLGVWFGRAVNIASYFAGFAGLLGGFGGWGWALNWLTHSLFLNGLFFSHFGFHGYGGYGFHSGGSYVTRAPWVHDPGHRLGVPYGNHYAGARYAGHSYNAGRSAYAGSGAGAGHGFNVGQSAGSGYRSPYQSSSRQMDAYRGLSAGSARGAASGYQSRYSSPAASGYRGGYAGNSASRGYSAPAAHYSAPKSSGGGHNYAGGGGGSHSHASGGGGGGHSHASGGGGHSHSGGGGHSHGGGHKR